MTEFDSFISNHLLHRNLAGLIFIVVVANLIFTGILLPYQLHQQAQAWWSSIITDIAQFVVKVAQFAWEAVKWAYANAQAAITAAATLWQQTNTILKDALKVAWNVLRKKMLNMLVDDIIRWIQGGGKPQIVTDWQSFLSGAANQAGGDFVSKYLGLGFLCKNFGPSLQIALAKPPTFNIQSTCTISQIVGNVNNFFNNFSSGGWKAWLSISESNNNPYGVYLSALDQKWGIESASAEAAKNEGISSSGFLGDKVCVTIESDTQTIGYSQASGLKEDEIPEGFKCTKWYTRTPGQTVADTTSKAVTVNIDWLISSKEWQEYLGAIVDAVINRAIREGVTAMTTTVSSGPGIDLPPDVHVDISAYNDANVNRPAVLALIEQQELLNENLAKLNTEIQINLGFLYKIKDVQLQTLEALKNVIAVNCPLPAGVSKTTIDTKTTGNCSGGLFSCPCTTNTITNYKVSDPKVGEMILKETITTTFTCSLDGAITNTSYEISSSTAAVEKEINALNSEISDNQVKISQIEIAIADTEAYRQAVNIYLDAYDQVTQTASSTAETIMKEAKQKAIKSNQFALNTSSTDFNDFGKITSDLNLNGATKRYGEVTTKRGGGEGLGCQYATKDTLPADLCDAQTILSQYQAVANCHY